MKQVLKAIWRYLEAYGQMRASKYIKYGWM